MTYRSTGRSRAQYVTTTEDRVIFEIGSGESRFVPVTGDGPR